MYAYYCSQAYVMLLNQNNANLIYHLRQIWNELFDIKTDPIDSFRISCTAEIQRTINNFVVVVNYFLN